MRHKTRRRGEEREEKVVDANIIKIHCIHVCKCLT
jgi:hypothetical protein